jgi:hypothetical protein
LVIGDLLYFSLVFRFSSPLWNGLLVLQVSYLPFIANWLIDSESRCIRWVRESVIRRFEQGERHKIGLGVMVGEFAGTTHTCLLLLHPVLPGLVCWSSLFNPHSLCKRWASECVILEKEQKEWPLNRILVLFSAFPLPLWHGLLVLQVPNLPIIAYWLIDSESRCIRWVRESVIHYFEQGEQHKIGLGVVVGEFAGTTHTCLLLLHPVLPGLVCRSSLFNPHSLRKRWASECVILEKEQKEWPLNTILALFAAFLSPLWNWLLVLQVSYLPFIAIWLIDSESWCITWARDSAIHCLEQGERHEIGLGVVVGEFAGTTHTCLLLLHPVLPGLVCQSTLLNPHSQLERWASECVILGKEQKEWPLKVILVLFVAAFSLLHWHGLLVLQVHPALWCCRSNMALLSRTDCWSMITNSILGELNLVSLLAHCFGGGCLKWWFPGAPRPLMLQVQYHFFWNWWMQHGSQHRWGALSGRRRAPTVNLSGGLPSILLTHYHWTKYVDLPISFFILLDIRNNNKSRQ